MFGKGMSKDKVLSVITGAKSICYDLFHNILRLFDVSPNFSFTTSETMRDYYLWTCYIRVASGFAEQLGKLGNIRKALKCQRIIS